MKIKYGLNLANYSVYKWAFSFLRPYRWNYCLMLLCIFVISSIQLSIPKFIQYFIDDLIPQNNITLFYLIIGFITLLLIIMFYLQAYQNILRLKVQEKISYDIQLALFKQTRKIGVQYFEKHPIGETLALINSETFAIQRLYREYLPRLINWGILTIIALVMMFITDPLLTLLSFPGLILYYIIGPFFVKGDVYYNRQTVDAQIKLNQKIYENISGISELKHNTAEKWGIARIITAQAEWTKNYIRMMFYAYAKFAVRNFSFYVGFIFIIIYGYFLVQKQLLTVGAMTAFILYYFDAMKRVTGIISVVTQIQMLMKQAVKLYNFAKIKPQIEESPKPQNITSPKGEIIFNNVTFAYSNETPLIKKLELIINSKEKVAIVGKSGNGKSTILKLIGRLYDVDKGIVYIDGIPINELSIEQLREMIGYVFQESYLFQLTIRENILFGRPDASEEEMIQAAKDANAHDFIMELQDGYNTNVGERGAKLSGGQRQRIAIARLFLKDPKILILDEATSALDNVSESEVNQALKRLCENKTTIIVSHRESSIKAFAEKILYIENGCVSETGSHEELLQLKGAYYRLMKSPKEV